MNGYIGEIRMFAGHFAPQNWAFCHGQSVPIDQYHAALYSVIGFTYGYGAEKAITFNLPDLASRFPRGAGGGGKFPVVPMGKKSGSIGSILAEHLPAHVHQTSISTAVSSNSLNPADAFFGPVTLKMSHPTGSTASANLYASTSTDTTEGACIEVGESGGHEVISLMNPYLAVNFIICIRGIYPHHP